jgi:hypothetical protein
MIYSATVCSDFSASKELPFVTTVRDKVGAYLFDVETATMQLCTNYIAEAKKALSRALLNALR